MDPPRLLLLPRPQRAKTEGGGGSSKKKPTGPLAHIVGACVRARVAQPAPSAIWGPPPARLSRQTCWLQQPPPFTALPPAPLCCPDTAAAMPPPASPLPPLPADNPEAMAAVAAVDAAVAALPRADAAQAGAVAWLAAGLQLSFMSESMIAVRPPDEPPNRGSKVSPLAAAMCSATVVVVEAVEQRCVW